MHDNWTAEVTSKTKSSTAEIDYDDLPVRELAMDWPAFERAPAGDKDYFTRAMESLEEKKWLTRTSYDGIKDWAMVDLSDYEDYDAYVRTLKKIGPAYYNASRAQQRGYYSKFFDQQTFVGDVVALHTSAPERQGKPMPERQMRTVEQRGGYLSEIRQPVVPEHRVLWDRMFGTFRPQPGHRQGPLAVDEQLVSYLNVYRFGNTVNYDVILGHFGFLRDGIVYKTHLDFVKTLLDARNQAAAGANPADASLLDLRFIAYGSYLGTTPGLKAWKKYTLFKPALTFFDFSPARGGSVKRAPPRLPKVAPPPPLAPLTSFEQSFLDLAHRIPADTPEEREQKIASLIPEQERATAIAEAKTRSRSDDSYLVNLVLHIPAADPRALEGKIRSLISENTPSYGGFARFKALVRALFRQRLGS